MFQKQTTHTHIQIEKTHTRTPATFSSEGKPKIAISGSSLLFLHTRTLDSSICMFAFTIPMFMFASAPKRLQTSVRISPVLVTPIQSAKPAKHMVILYGLKTLVYTETEIRCSFRPSKHAVCILQAHVSPAVTLTHCMQETCGMPAHKPDVPPARALPHRRSKSLMSVNLTGTSKRAGLKHRAWQTQYKPQETCDMQAHKPGVPPARAVPHRTSKSLMKQVDWYLQARRTQKTRMANTTQAHRIHAACLHTMPACRRHVRYQQAPHGANTTPMSANVLRIHCKHRARKKHAPLASAAPASSIASLHNACMAQSPQHPGQHAPGTIILPARLCSAQQSCNLVRQYPLSKSMTILGENFDHFFFRKKENSPQHENCQNQCVIKKQILACRPTAVL